MDLRSRLIEFRDLFCVAMRQDPSPTHAAQTTDHPLGSHGGVPRLA